jgi:hypothetical protein
MAKRLHMTNADYVAIAISPALIMLLVGSLVFFLIEVAYVGEYAFRLNYAFALFVFAGVLIARIAIEMGSERASLFASALGVAMFLFLVRFVEHPSPYSHLINLVLMAVVWWCAHQLTWDCTLIDDDQDSSGEGLMQRIGVDGPEKTEVAKQTTGTTNNELFDSADAAVSKNAPWWRRVVPAKNAPHTPGLWVLYFSLAALPLFGIAQHFIPAADVGRRRYAFSLLLVYVASALSLLVTTSFLGLRRYLRQRQIEMPATIAATWVGIGAVLILIVMFFAALIPRPAAEYAISQVPWRVGSPAGISTSRFSPGEDATEQKEDGTVAKEDADDKDGTGQQSTKNGIDARQSRDLQNARDSENGQSSSASAQQSATNDSRQAGSQQSDDASKGSQSSQGRSPQDKPSDGTQPRSDAADQSAKSDGQQGENQSRSQTQRQSGDQSPKDQAASKRPAGQPLMQHPPTTQESFSPQNILRSLGGLVGALKIAFYALVAFFVGYLIWMHRLELARAIAEIFRELRNLLAGLFGGGSRADWASDGESQVVLPPPRRFVDFEDPFATGRHRQMPPEELVRYTFAAFEAWANDRGCPRSADRTPSELIRSALADADPMFDDARRMVRYYGEAAYGSGRISRQSVDELQALWRSMREARQPVTAGDLPTIDVGG